MKKFAYGFLAAWMFLALPAFAEVAEKTPVDSIIAEGEVVAVPAQKDEVVHTGETLPYADASISEPDMEAKATEMGPLPVYRIDAKESWLKFIALVNDAPVEGGFKKFSGDIKFDPERIKESGGTITVQLDSLISSHDEMQEELKKPTWFNIAQYGEAKLAFKEMHRIMRRTNYDQRYFYGDADLTIKGVTLPVTVNFIMENLNEDKAVVTGRISLMRRDYHVGEGEWEKTDTVDDVVSISFRVVANRIKDKKKQ